MRKKDNKLKRFFIRNKYKLVVSLVITILSWLLIDPYLAKCTNVVGDIIYSFCGDIMGKILGIFVVVNFFGVFISTFISEFLYLVFSFNLPDRLIWIFSFIFSFILYYLSILILIFILNKMKKWKDANHNLKDHKKFAFLILLILVLSVGTISAVSQTISVNVVDTRDIKIYYVPVDDVTNANFQNGVSNFDSFIEDVYPLADDGLISKQRENNFEVEGGGVLSEYKRALLFLKLYGATKLSGSKYGVGVVRDNWISERLNISATGLTRSNIPSVVLAEADQIKTAGHEIAHKRPFNLCDENDTTVWTNQNNSLVGGCPNGDLNNDGSLDQICVDNNGCPISTFPELYNYASITKDDTLRNFMGPSDDPSFIESGDDLFFQSWVSNNTYNVLLNELEKSEQGKTKGLIINYLLYKYGTAELISSYVAEDVLLSEQSEFINIGGNFSTRTVNSSGSILNNITFDVEFNLITETGELIPTNVTPVTIVLPFTENVTKFDVINMSNITIIELNKTPNTPSLSITSNLSNQTFSGEEFNVTWNSSDADGDSIVHAILFSSDDGGNYTTLEIDYNQTEITLNSSNLDDCSLCRIKILATDGINTNSSVSESFTIDATPPNIASVIVFNESGVVDGDVEQGDNVSFNVTVTDDVSDVDSVWLKIWDGVAEVSNVILERFLSLVSGDLWSVEVETNESFSIGEVNFTIYTNDSLGNEANVSGNFNIKSFGTLDVNITFPLDNFSIGQNETFEINATVTCKGANAVCGGIFSLARYNVSATPDTEISTTAGDIPFFTMAVNQSDGFDVGGAGSSIPRGITLDSRDDSFWVVDGLDDFVYHFNGAGVNQTDGFDIGGAGATFPHGVAFDLTDNSFWVTDAVDSFVYHFNSAGVNQTDGFDVGSAGSGVPRGIAIDLRDNSFWIVDSGDSFVYHFNGAGVNQTDGFDVGSAGAISSLGLAFDSTDNSFWIVDSDDDFVYHFSSIGVNQTDGFDIIGAGANLTNGITFDSKDNSFWITDFRDDFVYHFLGRMNPKISHKNLEEGESFNITWIINASGANGTQYELDVFFNSSYGNSNVPDNKTSNVTICIGGCAVDIILPNDTSKFSHRNSSGDIVAWLGNEGNIVLAGSCFSGTSCDNPGSDSLIIRNSTDSHVAFINSTGDLCLEKGDCSDQSATCNPSEDALIVRNESKDYVIYIDGDGDLCLIGGLYENADL